jgi:hypothetical protein
MFGAEEGMELMVFCACATCGIGRPSLGTRCGSYLPAFKRGEEERWLLDVCNGRIDRTSLEKVKCLDSSLRMVRRGSEVDEFSVTLTGPPANLM